MIGAGAKSAGNIEVEGGICQNRRLLGGAASGAGLFHCGRACRQN